MGTYRSQDSKKIRQLEADNGEEFVQNFIDTALKGSLSKLGGNSWDS
ncbi:hypothetical protein [Neobacillus cucumis]|nr:hypothetical protein [Neobacillus cucumis]